MSAIEPGDDLFALGRRHTTSAGDVVFEVGDPVEAVHLVVRGVVLVRAVSIDGDAAVVDVRGRGDILDDSALLERPHLHYEGATAATDVELRRVPMREFDEVRDRSPALGATLVELLTEQVRRLSMSLVDQFAVPGKRRAARCLLRIHDALTRSGMDRAPVTMRQRELADFVGTTRSTINTYLREFEAAGAVELTRGRLAVVDAAVLDRFV
jgi:CRP-like cAMP-binding protein